MEGGPKGLRLCRLARSGDVSGILELIEPLVRPGDRDGTRILRAALKKASPTQLLSVFDRDLGPNQLLPWHPDP